ncbi:YciK family oxidoreductase [Bermanella marisrubri]|uniref:Short chain dehydrogenase n=1 Tax=Bermanella marisrubri TaxID=207949 RepID=Q1N5E0_9GAMM|nr:YciK family oxidoreductase [Bermanella marisrubri]EAT13111.1 short chain dehydrogenase [Oceanobacter sp. RED65] [Bermanella marisrubri]QIZ83889.1 YciK family oxidoreductase [Bermanella marisrubri]
MTDSHSVLPLDQRVILVTGASKGIGRAMVYGFAEAGATVIMLARNEEALNHIHDDLVAKKLPQPVIVQFDLEHAPEEAYFQLRDMINEEFGRLDGLLLNASLLGQRTPLSNYNWQTWNRVMNINVNSTFLLARTLLPVMEQSPADASILMTSSSVGRKSKAYWGAYAVSKFATEGLMQTMAEELENTSNVRVNSINPGGTRTDMRAEAYPAEDPATVKSPEDLVARYIYLMSAESKGINGQALDI